MDRDLPRSGALSRAWRSCAGSRRLRPPRRGWLRRSEFAKSRESGSNRRSRYHLQMIRSLVVLLLAVLCLAQDPIAPHSAFEPPAAKAAASLAASTKAAPPELLTTGEK